MANAAHGTPALEHEALTMPVPVDLAAATVCLEHLGERFAALVESIETPGTRAHRLEWTVAETAVHVAIGFDYYAATLKGEDFGVPPRSPGEAFTAYFARENKAQIDAEPERDPVKIAARLRDSLGHLVDAARAAGPDGVSVFPGPGYSEDVTTSVCTIIGEVVVHGFDIARAIGAEWKVDPKSAVLAVYATTAALPLALDHDAAAGKDIHVKVHLRHGTTFSIHFRDGRAWCDVTDERADAHVSADPLAYLLVGYGRIGLPGPIARGQLLVWGRKPWVVLQVPKLLMSP
jgi:uncharacterized protein (TIGR03083 family)